MAVLGGNSKRYPLIKNIVRTSAVIALLGMLLCCMRAGKPVSFQLAKDIKIGQSANGHEIRAQRFGRGARTALVLAGIHGNEPASFMLAQALADSLAREPLGVPLKVIIVPAINPDGLTKNERVNGHGVDINRNFPAQNWQREAANARYAPGPVPASEPETQAILKLIADLRPQLVISIHAPFHCINWDGPAEGYAQTIAAINGYPLRPQLGYPTPGSLGSFIGLECGIPVITLELPEEDDSDLSNNLPALRAALKQAGQK